MRLYTLGWLQLPVRG